MKNKIESVSITDKSVSVLYVSGKTHTYKDDVPQSVLRFCITAPVKEEWKAEYNGKSMPFRIYRSKKFIFENA